MEEGLVAHSDIPVEIPGVLLESDLVHDDDTVPAIDTEIINDHHLADNAAPNVILQNLVILQE